MNFGLMFQLQTPRPLMPLPSARAVRQQHSRVLVVIGSELAKLVREVSATLPIVYITPGDPVAQGLAASLAHPGGHTTAMTFEYPELAGKRLELLRAMLPQVRRVSAHLPDLPF